MKYLTQQKKISQNRKKLHKKNPNKKMGLKNLKKPQKLPKDLKKRTPKLHQKFKIKPKKLKIVGKTKKN